jgi:hypothetical protein
LASSEEVRISCICIYLIDKCVHVHKCQSVYLHPYVNVLWIYIHIYTLLVNSIFDFTLKVLLRLRNGPVPGVVPSLDTPPAVQAKVVFVTYEKKPMTGNIPFSLFGGKF